MIKSVAAYAKGGMTRTDIMDNEKHNSKVRVRLNGDTFLAFSIVVIMYYSLFNSAIFAVFDRFQLPWKNIVDTVLLLLQSLAIALGLFIALQRKPALIVCTYIGIIAMYLATMLIYPANKPILLGTCKYMFVFCVPSLILICSLKDKSVLYHQLSLGMYPLLLCGIIYSVLVDTKAYSMWLGYQMLLPCMLLVLRMLKGRVNLVSFIALLVSIFLMLTKGSRGPLLVLSVYIIMGFVYYKCRARIRPQICNNDTACSVVYYRRVYRADMLILAFFAILAIALALANIQSLCKWLYDFLSEQGIVVRTLRILSMDNGLLYTSGRDSITECALQAIVKRPLLGYGLGGDCVYIGREVYHFLPIDSGGVYAHNLILELCMHYGVMVGLAIFFSFVCVVIRKWRSLAAESTHKDLLIVAAVYGFIQSMITGTYLTNCILWLLLGLATSKTCDMSICAESEE